MSEIYKLSGFQQELDKAERFFTMHLTRQELKNRLDKIERLNKDNGDITKLFAKEREETKRLHSIIKEVREYIEENKASLALGRDDFTCEIVYSDEVVLANELLEILDKVGEE